jgi:hypothetical protein
MKTTIPQLLIVVLIVCLGFLSKVQAVSPAPDGGYPGGNTAEGQNALLSLTTGTYNTAVGIYSLLSDTAGSYNTALGAGALFANKGHKNTATGFGALFSNTGQQGVDGDDTADGSLALFSNTTGRFNTAVGEEALLHVTAGNNNTAVGFTALVDTTGHDNTAIGSAALNSCTTGSDNIAVGMLAGVGVGIASHTICIGADGNDIDNSCYIGQIFNATSSGGVPVYVNSNGRLGTATSSSRFKEGITPMAQASEKLFSLKPVTFRYKKGIDPEGPEGKSQFGLVAEDVDHVNPDLVVRDKAGKPYSVRYDQVNAMLLNEFLKEHKAFEQEQHKVEQLEKQIEALTAGLQKLSAQLELNKSASQTVVNGR